MVACLLITVGVTSGCAAQESDDRARKDAVIVHCLSPSSRPQLIDAAVALQVADRSPMADQVRVKGHDLTIERWRADRPGDFRRTCAAIAPPAGSGGSQDSGGQIGIALLTAVLSLLASLLTAVLTGVITVFLAQGARRRELASALRTATAGLMTAGDVYLAGFSPGHQRIGQGELYAKRGEVDAALHRIFVMYPLWRVIRDVRATLMTPPLDDELDIRMSRGSTDLDQEIRRLRMALTYRTEAANWVANAVESPIRWWRKLRGPLPDDTEGSWLRVSPHPDVEGGGWGG